MLVRDIRVIIFQRLAAIIVEMPACMRIQSDMDLCLFPMCHRR